MTVERNYFKGTHKTCGQAWAHGTAKVYAFGGANVTADGDAVVEASGDATVYAYDNATVFASEWSRVFVRAGSPEIYAKGWSTVIVSPAATPKIMLAGAAVQIDHHTYPATVKLAVKTTDEAAFAETFDGLEQLTEGREHASHKTAGNPGRRTNRRRADRLVPSNDGPGRKVATKGHTA